MKEKFAGGANERAIRLQRKAAARLSNSEAEYYLQSALAGHYEDSRFSAISSILVTEFQLRPVPGVFRILWMRGQGSLD